MALPLVVLTRPFTNSGFFIPPFSKKYTEPQFALYPRFRSIVQERDGFHLFTQKKRSDGDISVIEAENFDEDEDFDVNFEYEEEDNAGVEDGVDVDDDVIIPVMKIDAWLKKKPKGFGQGKVYNTSIEDKLLEEIEQSRKAQLANINKLKSNSAENKPKFEEFKRMDVGPEVITEISVRINNLPRKKNIHRDLKSAFEGVPGLINISPAVSGNKKTKDPVCRGFAFVNFRCLEDANRFIQLYSGQSISFGNVNKPIRCEMVKSVQEESTESRDDALGTTLVDHTVEGERDVIAAEIDEDPASSYLRDEVANDEDIRADMEYLNASDLDEENGVKSPIKPQIDTMSSKLLRSGTSKWKSVAKRKTNKSPTLKITGAAKKLKIKEKAVLADVFSRYGTKADLPSGES